MLRAMEDEHEQIDPALAAVTAGLASMVEHPCADHRNALDVHVTASRAALLDHLAHEESDALPFLQTVMSVEEYAACEKAAAGAYPLRLVPFLVAWAFDGVPDEVATRFLARGRGGLPRRPAGLPPRLRPRRAASLPLRVRSPGRASVGWVAMDGDLVLRGGNPWGHDPGSAVLVRGGRIARVGQVSAEEAAGAEVVDVTGRLVLPAWSRRTRHLDKTLTGLPWEPHSAGDALAERITNDRTRRHELGVPRRDGIRELLRTMAAAARRTSARTPTSIPRSGCAASRRSPRWRPSWPTW